MVLVSVSSCNRIRELAKFEDEKLAKLQQNAATEAPTRPLRLQSYKSPNKDL